MTSSDLLKDVKRCERIAAKYPDRESEYFYCYGYTDDGREWSKKHGYPVSEDSWSPMLFKKEQNGYIYALKTVPYFEKRKING